MSKITDLFDYFLNCPQLHDLLAISGEASKGKEIFFPRGSSPIYAIQNENIDVLGNYNGTFSPFPSLYEDWQMNLYRHADIFRTDGLNFTHSALLVYSEPSIINKKGGSNEKTHLWQGV